MKALRVIVYAVLALLVLVFFVPLVLNPTRIGAVVKTLPFGWLHFLRRNIPQITFDWGLIATGLICTAGMLLLGTWLISALFQRLHSAPPDRLPRNLKWSWSFGLYAGIWVLFLIAFGAAGLFRQTAWLLRSTEPWHEERVNPYMELVTAANAVDQSIAQSNQDLEKTRQSLGAASNFRRPDRPLFEDFNIILYPNGSDQVAAYLIVPRNPKLLAKGDFAFGGPRSAPSVLPLARLRETLSRLEAEHPPRTFLGNRRDR